MNLCRQCHWLCGLIVAPPPPPPPPPATPSWQHYPDSVRLTKRSKPPEVKAWLERKGFRDMWVWTRLLIHCSPVCLDLWAPLAGLSLEPLPVSCSPSLTQHCLPLVLQNGALPGRTERLLPVDHESRGAEGGLSRGGRPSLLPLTGSSIQSGCKWLHWFPLLLSLHQKLLVLVCWLKTEVLWRRLLKNCFNTINKVIVAHKQ